MRDFFRQAPQLVCALLSNVENNPGSGSLKVDVYFLLRAGGMSSFLMGASQCARRKKHDNKGYLNLEAFVRVN